MKTFEMWFSTTDEYRYCESEDTELMKIAWRAALAEVQNQMDQDRFMANGELRTWIEQELEE